MSLVLIEEKTGTGSPRRGAFGWAFGLSLALLTGCGTGTPNPTTSTNVSDIIINDAATGSCPVHVWLDSTGPVTLNPGSIYTFSRTPVGSHTITMNVSGSASCGGVSYACRFYWNQTGQACSFQTYAGQSKTLAIVDDGCNNLNVTCPYPF